MEGKKINNNGLKYIDLGLPSGTLWATTNVGSKRPSGYGLYFQWGDLIGYASYQVGKHNQFDTDWSDYKWNPSGDGQAFTKYIAPGAKLDLLDDAAHFYMGGDWHMPTPTQCQELLDNTTRAWTALDGISGMAFTSKKDASKSIFIPAVGGAWNGSVHSSGDNGYVWSSMLNANGIYYGQVLYFSSSYVYLYSDYRCFGLSVRGVIG